MNKLRPNILAIGGMILVTLICILLINSMIPLTEGMIALCSAALGIVAGYGTKTLELEKKE